MTKYDAKRLLIGKVGHAKLKEDDHKMKVVELEKYVIVKTCNSNDEKYINILTNEIYKDFHSSLTFPGDLSIFGIFSLTDLIDKLIEENLKFNNQEIDLVIDKIAKRKKVTDKEVSKLISFINILSLQSHRRDYIDNVDQDNKLSNKNNSNNEKLDFISFLTKKNYKSAPAIGRDKEIDELIITLAQDRKNPILVGPSGTGKTAIVEQLSYQIQNNKVPQFLKDKKIIELDMTSLLSGTMYAGVLEDKVNKLINIAIENDAIVFIDEIHAIYGAGTTKNNDNDVAGMLKQAIDRRGLRIIGTTTDYEYDKYFSSDALKRRFEKVLVTEPKEQTLYQIINKVFDDYEQNNKIKRLQDMDQVIDTLVWLTDNEQNRSYDDKVCNPDLVIGIIDKIFANAKVNEQNTLTMDNIVYGISSCNRIYDVAKDLAIEKLSLVGQEEKEIQKVISFKNILRNKNK